MKEVDKTLAIHKPTWVHDCDNCKFLGNHKNHDLYFHSSSERHTVIARYGNEVWEYISGIEYAREGGNGLLLEAKKRAKTLGYL